MHADDKNLRKHLSVLLGWGDAHVDFDAAIKGLPPRLRGVQPEGLPYSPWQLLEHLRITQHDILDFCVNPKYRAMKWPADYWPRTAKPSSAKAWQKSVVAFRADRRLLQRLVSNPTLDLYATIPHGEGQTYLREFLLVADHSAYHVGELVAVRRLLGAWKL